MQHKLRSCPTETIDGLVVIPHDKQIIFRCCKHFNNIKLYLVNVLKLINKDVLKLSLPCRENIFPLPEKFIGINKHIIEIDQFMLMQIFMIFSINSSKNIFSTVGGIVMFDGDSCIFYHTDLSKNG